MHGAYSDAHALLVFEELYFIEDVGNSLMYCSILKRDAAAITVSLVVVQVFQQQGISPEHNL